MPQNVNVKDHKKKRSNKNWHNKPFNNRQTGQKRYCLKDIIRYLKE